MKSLTKVMIMLVMILLVGFTIVKEENKTNEPAINEESISVNEEESLTNTSIIDYLDKGEMTASWYGPRFNGKKTANGEIFDQSALTAAHKKLRFGTLLRITNPENDKSVIVRINDRGPYIRGRQLDLSKAAANAIGMLDEGVIKVKIEQVSLKGVNFPVITLN